MTKQHVAPQAKDFMTRRLHCITPEMPLAKIVEFLEKHDISNAPVVEKVQGRQVLVGFLSEQDCLEHLANESFYGSPYVPQTAGTIMRKHPVCVSPDTELFTLASILVSHGYRHLPVVDDGELVGIVSRRDILRAMNEFYRDEMRKQDQERRPPDLHQIMHHRFIVSGRK